MQRVVVVGSSGAGKTTLARALAARLGVPHVELDALHHLPDWQEAPDEQFLRLVRDATAGPGWVADGNYTQLLQDTLWPRADTVVFLDLPRWRSMTRLARRTLRRLVTREELWHGNREEWARTLSTDPDRNVLLYAWRAFPRRAPEVEEAFTRPGMVGVRLVRLRTPRAVGRFLGKVERA